MNDLISIIIPCKNGMNYLKNAIEGIRSQEMNVEILVVDDGSTDATATLARDLGCKVISHGVSRGQVAAKNTGIRAAAGQYLMFHDHDDVMRPGAMRELYTALTADSSFCAVMAKVQDYFSPELSVEERAKTLIKAEPYWGLFTGAVLMKKALFDQIGLFAESIHTGEIMDWSFKLRQHDLLLKKLDFVATNRRVHATNFGKTHAATEHQNYAAVLRARLKR